MKHKRVTKKKVVPLSELIEQMISMQITLSRVPCYTEEKFYQDVLERKNSLKREIDTYGKKTR